MLTSSDLTKYDLTVVNTTETKNSFHPSNIHYFLLVMQAQALFWADYSPIHPSAIMSLWD